MLHEVTNSGNARAWCGPTVVSAITGHDVVWVKKHIADYRRGRQGLESTLNSMFGRDVQRRVVVKGTHWWELAHVLERTGRKMVQTSNYGHLTTKDRPTFAAWLKKYRYEKDAIYIVGLTNHWIVVEGRWMLDTHTKGKPVRCTQGPHRRRRVETVWKVVMI